MSVRVLHKHIMASKTSTIKYLLLRFLTRVLHSTRPCSEVGCHLKKIGGFNYV